MWSPFVESAVLPACQPPIADAEARDVIADPRMLQANERTLLAWLRTGVSLITFGFVISRTSLWLRTNEPRWTILGGDLIGAAFVLLGAIAESIGVVRYLRIRRALLAG